MQYRKNIILDFVHVMRYCVLLRKEAHTMTTLKNLYYGNIAPYKLTTIIGFTDKKRNTLFDISCFRMVGIMGFEKVQAVSQSL